MWSCVSQRKIIWEISCAQSQPLISWPHTMGHKRVNNLLYHWFELKIHITIPGVEPAVLWINWKHLKYNNRVLQAKKWSIQFKNRVYTYLMDPKGHHYPLEMKWKVHKLFNYKINSKNYKNYKILYKNLCLLVEVITLYS